MAKNNKLQELKEVLAENKNDYLFTIAELLVINTSDLGTIDLNREIRAHRLGKLYEFISLLDSLDH